MSNMRITFNEGSPLDEVKGLICFSLQKENGKSGLG